MGAWGRHSWAGHNTFSIFVQGYGLDETLLNWVLTVLIVVFMFCAGLVIVNFPWMFMGEITHLQMSEICKTHIVRTLVEAFYEYCEKQF